MDAITELKDATTNWMNKASQVFNKEFKIPTVSLDLNGKTAGMAYYSYWMIKFNPALYNNNKEDFVASVVPHEIAHLIARDINPNIKPHGREWKMVMRKLGVKEITRCHNYDVSMVTKVRERPYVYACLCKEHPVSKTIHRRIIAGKKYVCRKCRNPIVLK